MHKNEDEPWLWTQDPGANKCPKGWQIILDQFPVSHRLTNHFRPICKDPDVRTQVPGCKYGDKCPCVDEVNGGTSEHLSVDEGR